MTDAPAVDNSQVFALAWPIAVNGLLVQAIVLVDTLIVAPLGEQALAAMGLAASIASLVIGLLFALFNGTQILLAQGHGAGDADGMRSTFWVGLIVGSAVVSVAILVIMFTGDGPLVTLALNTRVGELAHDYLLVFTSVLIGITLSQHMTVTLYAIGRSRLTFFSTMLEAPVNIILSIALVQGLWGFPSLGVVGAAIGSAVAVWLRAVSYTHLTLPTNREV